VYGKYHDVAAKDFLKAQIDTEFRKTWDNTALNLNVVEQDNESNSDIVSWEMKWPVRVRLLHQCNQTTCVKLMSTMLLGKRLHIPCQKL
jgi:hypothetical protein